MGGKKRSRRGAKEAAANDDTNDDKPEPKTGDNFLKLKAAEDTEDAKTRHCRVAFERAKELHKQIATAVAHGATTDSQDMALATLEEVAGLASELSSACRNGKVNAVRETRNLQPT